MDLDSERHTKICAIIKDLPGISAMHSVDYTLLRLILAVIVAEVHCVDNINDKMGEDDQEEDLRIWSRKAPPPTSIDCVKDLVSHIKHADPAWLQAVTEAVTDLHSSSLPTSLKLPSTTAESPTTLLTLASQINSNAHGFTSPSSSSSSADTLGCGLYPLIAMLNHSCDPNATYVAGPRGAMAVRVIRDVCKDEEVTVSYVDLSLPRWERRQKLLHTKSFWCECTRCVDVPDPSELERFSNRSLDSSEEEDLLEQVSKDDEDMSVGWGILDAMLEGVWCQSNGDSNCKSIYIRSNDSLEDSSSSTSWKCLECGHTPSSTSHTALLTPTSKRLQDAQDMLEGGLASSAVLLLQNSLAHPDATYLHPRHHLITTTWRTLSEAAERSGNLVVAVRAGIIAIKGGKGCGVTDAADSWCRIGELAEAVVEGVAQGIIVDAAQNHQQDWSQVANLAFEKCYKLRRLTCGKTHPRTLAVKTHLKKGSC